CLFALAPSSARGWSQLDLPLGALDLLNPDADLVAEAVRPAAAAPGERRAERVRLEVVAPEAARWEEAFEDLAEAAEQAGADQTDDLSVPLHLPPAFEQLVFEQPCETQLVREVLDPGRFALAAGRVLGEAVEVAGDGIVRGAELAQQCAVDDEVR